MANDRDDAWSERTGADLRLGVHESVGELFPPAVLRDELADAAAVEVVDDPADVDALVTFEYEDAFLSADLGWIHSIQAGVDRFPFGDLEARGVALTNSTGIHGDVVGETVTGYMLSFARRLHAHRSNQDAGRWEFPDWDRPFTLRGERLCVVGLGTLGRGIARRADALGMDVTGVKRTPTPVDHVRRVRPPEDLTDAVGDARFIALAVPLVEETRGLIGADELAAMRDDAYLVNVARGPVVDESALVEALRADALAGAALDVFEAEPLPDDSPLWDMDEVLVTPHAAAANREYYRRVATLVRRNVRHLDEGRSLVNRVV
ncbi:MAG: D-2-hydroxyacid dehydrogenase [Haloferacaceae archaeon]